MIENILLFTNLGLLLLHEIDAICCKEWKMFVFLNKLKNEKAKIIFILLHVPLIIIIFFLIKYRLETFFWIFNIFLIFHLLLHKIFYKHKFNNFKSIYSSVLIMTMSLIATISILLKLLGV